MVANPWAQELKGTVAPGYSIQVRRSSRGRRQPLSRRTSGGFHNALMSGGWMDLQEPEIGSSEQRCEFFCAALHTPGNRQHHQIYEFAVVGRIASREHGFHDQEPPVFGDRSAAIAQDRQGLLIPPIMQHVREDVSVMPCWQRGEE